MDLVETDNDLPGNSPDEIRLTFIQNVSVALSRADSLPDVAKIALAESMTALGASAGSVSLARHDTATDTIIHCIGLSSAAAAACRDYTREDQLPSADAMKSGAPLFIDTVAERRDRYPLVDSLSEADAGGAFIALPLTVNGCSLGALALTFPTDRGFSRADRVFALTIAQICAQAMARQQEIDERKKAEGALRETEARKAAILEVSLDCIITMDDAGRIVDWNPAAERTFGRPSRDVLGRMLADLIIPEACREAHNRGLVHYLATGHGPLLSKRIEVDALHADGTEIPIELTILPLRLEHRVLFTAYVRDIHQRKLAVAQQRAFVRDVLMSVTEGKLHICSDACELPALMSPIGQALALSLYEGLAQLRHGATDAASQLGHPRSRSQDLATAVSEAAMNAIIHGGGGEGQVLIDEARHMVQVRIADHGKGIAFEDLPHAALARGFSTKASLGHGLKMMTETVDRVFLLTGAHGTTIVLEQERVAPLPMWLV